jgi:hypothetical protein
MAQVPTVGADVGTWGAMLNNWLVPEFNTPTADYTLVLGDLGKIVGINSASANNLTVPPNSSVAFPVGAQITIRQPGAGQTTIVAGSGVTVNARGAALKLAGQFAQALLTKTATDTWELSGDLST